MLMAVYNVSINRQGFKYLHSKTNLITQLAWIVQSNQHTHTHTHRPFVWDYPGEPVPER